MNDAKAQIAFQQVGVAGVLKQYWLSVPSNQREYSWTEKHVTTLFQDFGRAISEEASEYFLGTIVVIPRASEQLEVVDGQQRLATTAILLCAIRNYLQEKDPIIAESITNGFLTDIDRIQRQRIPKLKLNDDDNEFFRGMIVADRQESQPSPAAPSHELIKEAFKIADKHVRNIVSQFDEKDHGDILNRWIDFVEHRAQVILLKVPSDANAYKMFETLNDRGLKTSQADLVKNYLFGQSGDRLKEAQQKWARIRGALESLDENDITVTFLRQALIAMRGHLKENEVYEEVQRNARGPQTSIQFLTVLENLGSIYTAIFNPEHEKWNSYPEAMRRGIETLNLLNIKTFRPLMLAVANGFDKNEAAKAYKLLISLGVRLMIASNTSRGSVEVPLANSAKLVFAKEIKNTNELKKKIMNVIPQDEQFRKAFEVATVSKISLARYYLRSIELTAKGEQDPSFVPNQDAAIINLEHILPEHPADNWPDWEEEDIRAYFKRIGNLALLRATHNSDLKNSNFKEKSKVYQKSPYVLTKQISEVQSWTQDSISMRQKTLASLAVNTWPI